MVIVVIFSLEVRKCSPTGAWLGQGVRVGGVEGVSEPHALLAVEGSLSLASPVDKRIW